MTAGSAMVDGHCRLSAMAAGETNPLDLAGYYLTAGRPGEALDVLRRGDPADARTYVLRGQALVQLGENEEAERQVHRGLELEPEHVLLLMLLAQAQLPRDAFEAEETLRRALTHEPQNVALLSTYVMILMEQGRFEWAERILDRATKLAPEEMHAMRAVFLMRASTAGEARNATHDMLREAPDDAASHYLRGLALLGSGSPTAGLRHLREAAALSPADPHFVAAARTLGAWYLWPVHVTNGAVHYVLATLVVVGGLAAAFVGEDINLLWRFFLPFLGFVAYKWIAVGVSMWLLNRRVARAMQIRK